MSRGLILLSFGVGALTFGFSKVTERPINFFLSSDSNGASNLSEKPSSVKVMAKVSSSNDGKKNSIIPTVLGTSAALMICIGYSYLIINRAVKRMTDKAEKASQEIQELIREYDENKQKRTEDLDEKCEERTKHVSIDTRSEQRAHFDVMSKQFDCTIKITLQTLTAIAEGIISPLNGASSSKQTEIEKKKENLLQYAEKAQNLSDDCFKQETYEKTLQANLEECREQAEYTKTKIIGSAMHSYEDSAEKNNNYIPHVRKAVGTDTSRSFGESPTKTNATQNSLMELQFVKKLRLGHSMEYYTVKYIDPVYRLIYDHPTAFGGLTLGLFVVGLYIRQSNATQEKYDSENN